MQILVAIIGSLLGVFIPIIKHLVTPWVIEKNKENPTSDFVKIAIQIFSINKEDLSPPTPYKQKIEKTLEILKNASDEIDSATEEISAIMQAKQLEITSLEVKLQDLSLTENELRQRIAALQIVPLPAVGEFEKMISKGDKRSAFRDYILFVSGIIVSVILTVILKKLGYT